MIPDRERSPPKGLQFRLITRHGSVLETYITGEIGVCANGRASSGARFPMRCAEELLRVAINGIWTKSSSRSRVSHAGFGGRLIRTASFSTFWFKSEGTPTPHAVS